MVSDGGIKYTTSHEQKMICTKIDGAPEQQKDNQPSSSSIDAVTAGIDRVAIGINNTSDEELHEICANCGKEGGDNLKACTACKLVKYCNRNCQRAHRPQHKHECKRRAAEIHDAALFKEHPPPEDCPICMLPLPYHQNEFHSCCGKSICSGCILARLFSEGGEGKDGVNMNCPFCRELPVADTEEYVERLNKCMKTGNAMAHFQLGSYYAKDWSGAHESYQLKTGVKQDFQKANELYLKAGELGCTDAFYNLAASYERGTGVERNMNKANHFYELAAMNGHNLARHNLGVYEEQLGNYHRAYKHFVIAAKAGCEESLAGVKNGYILGFVTKIDYANTLRAYQTFRDAMKSDARDKADDFLKLGARELSHGDVIPKLQGGVIPK